MIKTPTISVDIFIGALKAPNDTRRVVAAAGGWDERRTILIIRVRSIAIDTAPTHAGVK